MITVLFTPHTAGNGHRDGAPRRRSPGSSAAAALRRGALALTMVASLLLSGLWGLTAAPAHAVDTGEVTALTLEPTTLANGAAGQLRVGWRFPAGTTVGDTIQISAASGFSLTAPAAFPNGQPFTGPGGVLLATMTVSGNNAITITREIPADGWGDVGSDELASIPFSYSGAIQPGTEETTVWPTSSGEREIQITGRERQPAVYGPSKSGRFSFSETGEPIITWTFKSPIGPHAPDTVQLVDSVGPGQELDCASISGTVRRWDQSFEAGADGWVSGLNWADAGPDTCQPDGFSRVLATEIPAPIPGGNTAIPEADRAANIAYAVLNYRTVVTDFALATSGWTNKMSWSVDGQSRTFPATVRFPGSASGNRVVTVEKLATGPAVRYEDLTFDVQVDCVANGLSTPGYPQTMQLGPNSSGVVYAPIGSVCSASETDAQGAAVTVSDPVAITHGLDDTFGLRVTNDFTAEAFPVAPVVTQSVCTAPGVTSPPELALPENTEGIHYSVSGAPAPGESVTVTVAATLQPGYVWPAELPEGWTLTDAGAAEFAVAFEAVDCPFEAFPVAPVVTQSVCTAPGVTSDPELALPENTEGIHYSVSGAPAPGESVTVAATLQPGYVWPAELPEGWVLTDAGAAEFAVAFEAVDCPAEIPDTTPPGTPDDPDPTPRDKPAVPRQDPPASRPDPSTPRQDSPAAQGPRLAATGSAGQGAVMLAGGAGILLALGATLLLRSRRRGAAE